ncbi:MAG TPA: hypothetical protein VHE30_01540 [Polyangiaceae bacterium]|nr:hypothetical protein [Polyangiaceae bacterium]
MTSKFLSAIRRAVLVVVTVSVAVVARPEPAHAQEILLTGPLAGAPAVRKQKYYRKSRFEIAPTATFSLLDEYQREIYFGARLQYNLTDWLALGAWGAFGAVKINTALAENIQTVNAQRRNADAARRQQAGADPRPGLDIVRTATNLGPNFTKQLGSIDWILAPQITVVPFRGKIALFQSIFADTDLYLFGGPAIIGVTERKDCGPKAGLDCTQAQSFSTASGTRFAPTFGLGFAFYTSKMTAFGFEWRGMPFARNTGGFDNHGAGPDNKFPDYSVNEKDREFKFNQMLTVSFGIYLPTSYQVSE